MSSPKSLFLIILSGLFLTSLGFYYYLTYRSMLVVPLSSQNLYYDKLNHALSLSNYSVSSINVRRFTHQVEFQLDRTQVILTDQKDPYKQVASLQKIFKEAKIIGKNVSLIDLSIGHPYATLKNN